MAKKPKDEALHHHTKKKAIPVRYTPNLTPLIDVLITLLLFFLLAAQFRVEEGVIPATLPAIGKSVGALQAGELPPAININVNPVGEGNINGYYEIQGQAVQIVDANELFERLAGKAQTYNQSELAKVPIIIKPRSDVRWTFVVEAFNQAARANFKSIAFAPVGS